MNMYGPCIALSLNIKQIRKIESYVIDELKLKTSTTINTSNNTISTARNVDEKKVGNCKNIMFVRIPN